MESVNYLWVSWYLHINLQQEDINRTFLPWYHPQLSPFSLPLIPQTPWSPSFLSVLLLHCPFSSNGSLCLWFLCACVSDQKKKVGCQQINGHFTFFGLHPFFLTKKMSNFWSRPVASCRKWNPIPSDSSEQVSVGRQCQQFIHNSDSRRYRGLCKYSVDVSTRYCDRKSKGTFLAWLSSSSSEKSTIKKKKKVLTCL